MTQQSLVLLLQQLQALAALQYYNHHQQHWTPETMMS
jgi:hypothetical protein